MVPPREIPGFFYDEEKKKYFKIEHSGPPAESPYSAQRIKRRRVEERYQADRARKAAFATVRPAPDNPLADPIVGGLFLHDLGEAPPDLARECWADGLTYRGAIEVGDSTTSRPKSSIASFLVGSDEARPGLCYLVAATGDGPVYARFLSRDRYNNIQRQRPTEPWLSCEQIWNTNSVSGLSWLHATDDGQEQSFLITSSSPSTMANVLQLSSMSPGSAGHGSLWEAIRQPYSSPRQAGCIPGVLACAAAPKGASGIIAALGTSRGIVTMAGTGQPLNAAMAVRSPGATRTGNSVLALDFLDGHPDVLIVGGRGDTGVWLTDLRQATHRRRRRPDRSQHVLEQPPQATLGGHPGRVDARYVSLILPECSTPAVLMRGPPGALAQVFGGGRRGHKDGGGDGDAHHRWLEVGRGAGGGAVNHVVSLNPYQVLAAGVAHRMDVWDVRRGFDTAYTAFPGYRNAARVASAGLAVERALGVVAAANDPGPHDPSPVRLHSLASGLPLPCRALDRDAPSAAAVGRPSPCLRWRTMPGDSGPSLFMARDDRVLVYSFGVDAALRGDEFG